MGTGASSERKLERKRFRTDLVIKTLIWQDWDDEDEKPPADKPYTGELTPRVKKIIGSALSEFKIYKWERNRDTATVKLEVMWTGRPKQDAKRLREIFGQEAVDTWMEGDIRIDPTGDDELDLEIVSINRQFTSDQDKIRQEKETQKNARQLQSKGAAYAEVVPASKGKGKKRRARK